MSEDREQFGFEAGEHVTIVAEHSRYHRHTGVVIDFAEKTGHPIVVLDSNGQQFAVHPENIERHL